MLNSLTTPVALIEEENKSERHRGRSDLFDLLKLRGAIYFHQTNTETQFAF